MLTWFKKYPELAGLATVLVIGIGFFGLTDPAKVPPAFFIIGFGLVMVGLYCILRLLGRASGFQARVAPFTYKSMLAAGTVLPVMLLALQSIGQLDARSMLTLIFFCAGVYFYVSRLRGNA